MNYWRRLAAEIGVTDQELWGARLVARFAEDQPEEYSRVAERFCREDGDPVGKMVAYVQQRMNEARQ